MTIRLVQLAEKTFTVRNDQFPLVVLILVLPVDQAVLPCAPSHQVQLCQHIHVRQLYVHLPREKTKHVKRDIQMRNSTKGSHDQHITHHGCQGIEGARHILAGLLTKLSIQTVHATNRPALALQSIM